MGKVFKSIGKAVSNIFGGGSQPQVVYVPAPAPTPTYVTQPGTDVPDIAKEQEKQESEALKRRQNQAEKGLSGTILGGSVGAENAVQKKRLLGE